MPPASPLDAWQLSLAQTGPNYRLARSVSSPARLRRSEILIAVEAAGVNKADLYQALGQYPLPPGASPVPGLEVCGRIVAMGAGVSRYRTGERVAALTDGGGYASHAVAPESLCLPVPEGVSPVKAALLPEALFTLWMAAQDKARLRKGERVFLYGGSGGVGHIALQLFRQLGHPVFTTASTPLKKAFCESLGATVLPSEQLVEAAKDATGGHGMDVILDMVGGSRLADTFAIAARRGRIVTLALQGGNRCELMLGGFFTKQLCWQAALLRPHTPAAKARFARGIRRFWWPLVEKQEISPILHAEFALEDAASALNVLAEGAHRGKMALIP